MMFDWNELQTPYGSANDVPQRLRDASATVDELDALDLTMETSSYVCFGETLNDGAPHYVSMVLECARQRYLEGRAAWPLLRGLVPLVEVRALYRDLPGFAPRWAARGRLSPDRTKMMRAMLAQHALTDACDRQIQSSEHLFTELLESGSSCDRAVAGFVAANSLHYSSVVGDLLRQALGDERNSRAWASILMSMSVAGHRLDVLSLRRELDAGDAPRRIGAIAYIITHGYGSLWPDVFQRAVENMSHQDATMSYERHDYVWHDEHYTGDLIRAYATSDLDLDEKIDVLHGLLKYGDITSDLRGPTHSPSSSAASRLMMLTLAGHVGADSHVGPEDLSEVERTVVNALSKERAWMGGAGGLVSHFGIGDFDDLAEVVSASNESFLMRLVEGVWEGREVRWSVWKWTRLHRTSFSLGSDGRIVAVAYSARLLLRACEPDDVTRIIAEMTGRTVHGADEVVRGLLVLARENVTLGHAADAVQSDEITSDPVGSALMALCLLFDRRRDRPMKAPLHDSVLSQSLLKDIEEFVSSRSVI